MGRLRARNNAIRAGVVVVGSVAFAYLSFRVGFKPYLEQAQETMDRLQQDPQTRRDPPSSSLDDSFIDSFPDEELKTDREGWSFPILFLLSASSSYSITSDIELAHMFTRLVDIKVDKVEENYGGRRERFCTTMHTISNIVNCDGSFVTTMEEEGNSFAPQCTLLAIL
ncbi:hypothetical protein Cni_G04406 [Canna indica]|uniref:Uncharacterized protein n=1 Tax=Canna indica TaxID=4628 RepID=A0AAQ3JVC5_9LILI|nr:hypothetical protein Cni_G04406 [Canna indica]